MDMKILRTLALVTAATCLAWGCDVDKTQEGEMPDVDVEGGQLPKYDVDAPDVDIGTQKKTVTVPDIDIHPADDDDDMDDPDNP